MTATNTTKVLLIQVRDDEPTRKQELECYHHFAGGGVDFRVHNLIAEPVTVGQLDGIESLIVGGSGDHSVVRGFPNMDSLPAVLEEARRRGLPILGNCFGAQIMAHVFGGSVVDDYENEEIGTYEIEKTAAAADDPLFGPLPERFLAMEGHHNRADRLPPDAVLLARSELCEAQAFRLGDEPHYAIQFHPELDQERFLWRLDYYRASYAAKAEEFDRIAAGLKDTPEATSLLKRWLDVIVRK
ncbi:type 1 glutamine amidotransferase [Patescibacteria group bacterium]